MNIKDLGGRTQLKCALEGGHTEIVNLLKAKERLSKAIVKKISEMKEKYEGKNLPPFLQAASDGNVEEARRVLLEDDGLDRTAALMIASYKGHTDVVKLLLRSVFF